MVLPLVGEWRDILQPQPHQDQREQLTHLSLSQGWLVIPSSSLFDNLIARGAHRVKFLKTFEFGAQRGEGYRGESALLCSQFQTQF